MRYLDSSTTTSAHRWRPGGGHPQDRPRDPQRFKETFDRVNQGLQQLFPRVFGGGHAYLELTGDDLLETGVTIMARPPGKRKASIHLLSGGEKALTAVALVFAIFQLNPAPFCMLDEVDAPLDDANVGRFCELVRSMSDQVQFIFITHNKVTMEIADHLIGVTMHEPGCSRLVSVDVEEAAGCSDIAPGSGGPRGRVPDRALLVGDAARRRRRGPGQAAAQAALQSASRPRLRRTCAKPRKHEPNLGPVDDDLLSESRNAPDDDGRGLADAPDSGGAAEARPSPKSAPPRPRRRTARANC
jgi:hypothetical protein